LVFQASAKSVSNKAPVADFSDFDTVKKVEVKVMKNIQNAKKKAELFIAKADKDINNYEQKALSDLTLKLERQYKLEDKKAKEQAKKIRAEGELQANRLTEETQAKKEKAVEYIVNAIIGGQ
jgi:vacuolar-type H+-ATPase subunit H